MPDNAMLDVSMLVHRDSLHQLIGLASAGALENIVLPSALVRMAESPQRMFTRMSQFLDLGRQDTDRYAFERFFPQLLDQVQTYPAESSYEDTVFRNLAEAIQDEDVALLLYQEYEFVTTQSWLFAKVRAGLDRLINAGASALHVSKRQFEMVTRRALKKPEGPLSPNDRVRAAAKWVAVGGTPVWALIEPISGAIGTAIGGFFLLYDP